MRISGCVTVKRRAAIILAFLAALPFGVAARQKQIPPEAASDPILRALRTELGRSKTKLKMDNVDSPFYIEYRVFDVEQFDASAAFGACIPTGGLTNSFAESISWALRWLP